MKDAKYFFLITVFFSLTLPYSHSSFPFLFHRHMRAHTHSSTHACTHTHQHTLTPNIQIFIYLPQLIHRITTVRCHLIWSPLAAIERTFVVDRDEPLVMTGNPDARSPDTPETSVLSSVTCHFQVQEVRTCVMALALCPGPSRGLTRAPWPASVSLPGWSRPPDLSSRPRDMLPLLQPLNWDLLLHFQSPSSSG